MNRVDDLISNKLYQELSDLESDLDAMKSAAQYIGGGQIRKYLSQTGNAFDFAGNLADDPNNTNPIVGLGDWIITATADHASIFYGHCLIYLYVNSTTALYLPSNYYSDSATSGTVGLSSNVVELSPVPATASNQRRFSVQIRGDVSKTVRFKAYVVGLDSAQVQVVQVR